MLHGRLLHNDAILPSDQPSLSAGQVGLLSGWGVFSTIRIASGVLFEYPRHYARMKRDAKNLRVPFPDDPAYIESRLYRLIDSNQLTEGTLRVVVVRNQGGIWQGPGVHREFDLIAFTTGLNDWGAGVSLGVVPQGRHAQSRFAGVKVLSWAANLTWYEEAHEHGYDEVVLLNEREEVSECTSANIFAVFDGQICTPPLSSGCLAGITRELLLNEIQLPGFQIIEQTLTLQDLEKAKEVFITSSTRDVLRVLKIEGLNLQPGNAVIPRLKAGFQSYIAAYSAKHKSLAV